MSDPDEFIIELARGSRRLFGLAEMWTTCPDTVTHCFCFHCPVIIFYYFSLGLYSEVLEEVVVAAVEVHRKYNALLPRNHER